jgi:NhaP-type Na+/H+ or K+/H+ antiporter
MKIEHWYLVLGALLVLIALASSTIKRLPLTTTILYFGVGLALGPLGFKALRLDPFLQAAWLERLAELAVIVSLFTAGLKLRISLSDRRWLLPLRLAFLSMILTVALVTVAGVYGLGLPLGAAVLLGAILAPTDPVLASEVQVESATDQSKLRFSLTGEAGFNDGTAFPFVMLGLGLLGMQELGAWGWRWLTVDLLWATVGGLGIGAALGAAVGSVVIYFRREHKESVGLDEFLAIGLIGCSYGAAVMAHTYGFLAVFAAGLALRAVERQHSGDELPTLGFADGDKKEEVATHPEKIPAYLAGAVLNFTEQAGRILEVALVLIVGAMVGSHVLEVDAFWFTPLLLLVIRPLAVNLGLFGSPIDLQQRAMISWFGIRGIGSLYYLMFAIRRGLPKDLAADLVALTLCAISLSVVVHGVSVTPMMRWYQSRRFSRSRARRKR